MSEKTPVCPDCGSVRMYSRGSGINHDTDTDWYCKSCMTPHDDADVDTVASDHETAARHGPAVALEAMDPEEVSLDG